MKTNYLCRNCFYYPTLCENGGKQRRGSSYICKYFKLKDERPKGEWIYKPVKKYCSPDCWHPPYADCLTWNKEEGSWLEDEMFCSKCDWQNCDEIKSNFCPNCGADMRKAEKPETCKGCLEPCIMYEPDMRGCKKKVREVSE